MPNFIQIIFLILSFGLLCYSVFTLIRAIVARAREKKNKRIDDGNDKSVE